jgi:Luciferase-like monooxygenase
MECGDPRFLVELAERAEAAGWDGVFLEDYVVFQGDPRAPTCDSWVALAGMAARTKSVVLGTSVTPLARRRPVGRRAAGRGNRPAFTGANGARRGARRRRRPRRPRCLVHALPRRARRTPTRADARRGARDHCRALERRAVLLPRRALHRRGGHVRTDACAAASDPDLDRRRVPQAGPDAVAPRAGTARCSTASRDTISRPTTCGCCAKRPASARTTSPSVAERATMT